MNAAGPFNDRTFLDTGLLRNLADRASEEKETALHLYGLVLDMRQNDDPAHYSRYRIIIEKINGLARYFHGMSASLAQIANDAEELSENIRRQMEADAGQTDKKTTQTFF